MRKLARNIVVIIYLFFAFSLVLSYLAKFISPETFWIPAFLGMGYPFILILNVLFLFYWLIRRKKIWIIVSLIIILAGWNDMRRLYQLRASTENYVRTENDISVMTFNVRVFDLYNWTHNKETRNQIVEFLKEEKPDILCFQEYYFDKSGYFQTLHKILEVADIKYHHEEFYNNVGIHQFGIATFSKYPIINKGIIKFEGSDNFCIYSDLKINEDTVRVFNNHLESIRFDNEHYRFIDSLKLNLSDEQINEARNIISKIKRAFVKRAQQADVIADRVEQCKMKKIVCGDFNDTPASYAYKKMQSNLADCFLEKGSGLGQSYSGKFPSFRIDYIFHSDGFETLSYKTSYRELSDHYPVSAVLKLK